MKPALNHMMVNDDAIATEFNTIIGYRTSHAGLVLAGITNPTLSFLFPTVGVLGETIDITVYGTGFASGASATFSGTGITVNSTTVSSSTKIVVNVTISATATASARTITITNTDTGYVASASAFTVSQGPFLPYGTADASVVYRNPLTAALTIGADATYTSITVQHGDNSPTFPEHSATLGMRGAAAGGTTATNYYLRGWPAGLDTAGQMTFEISRDTICQHSSQSNGSTGESLGTNMAFVGFCTDDNSNNGGVAFYRGSGNSGICSIIRQNTIVANGGFLKWGDRTATPVAAFHNYGKPSYIKVNIGWYTDGGTRRVVVSIDGVTLMTMARSDTANPFTGLGLGMRPTAFFGFASGTTPMIGANDWIRNLQVSTAAPTVPTTVSSGALKDIAILSDSILNAANWDAAGDVDNNYDARILRALERRGVRPTSFYRMSAGGHLMTELGDGATTYSFTVGNTAQQTSNLDGTAGSTNVEARSLVKARNATTIIINGGSNDVGTTAVTATLFRNACRDMIEYFVGLNGNAAPGVVPTRIMFTNICDRGTNWDSTARAKAATFRTEIDGLAAWFASTYPSAAASTTVSVIDTFNGMGGTTSYTGKIDADEVHPDYAGIYYLGETIGAALAALAP